MYDEKILDLMLYLTKLKTSNDMSHHMVEGVMFGKKGIDTLLFYVEEAYFKGSINHLIKPSRMIEKVLSLYGINHTQESKVLEKTI